MKAPTMHTLKLPRKFWDDHYDRCADHPGFREEVKSTKREVVVRLDDEALKNLTSDADYYSETTGFDTSDPWMMGLCASARATLARLVAHPVALATLTKIQAAERRLANA
jgi:hypothetical protein